MKVAWLSVGFVAEYVLYGQHDHVAAFEVQFVVTAASAVSIVYSPIGNTAVVFWGEVAEVLDVLDVSDVCFRLVRPTPSPTPSAIARSSRTSTMISKRPHPPLRV